ncbi:hypothetical protein KV557_12225 [Kitasatospora aureofaciens]|uniref:DUF7824 domain-containing protein n=1 Tax=Kitasatospora aureofaciens TaxID=1894 RepID=UPI001C4965FF|nr:DUF6493 family protein [Kitasatospora aureofaciens]MBV6697890.1 hypothetical protein [Kitasatospora aureofaciens]
MSAVENPVAGSVLGALLTGSAIEELVTGIVVGESAMGTAAGEPVAGSVVESSEPVGPVEALLQAVREGRTPQIPALVAVLDPAQRRACLPGLKAVRQEIRGEWSNVANARAGALLVAGAGCHVGPAGAATWIGSRDFSGRSGAVHPALAQVVEAQPVEWQIEVATRLAARPAPSWGRSFYPLIEAVVRRTGCAVPETEPFVREWLERRFRHSGARPTLAEDLRADAFTPALLPRVFELADIGGMLSWRLSPRPGDVFAEALAELAAGGVLDRADVIDRCLARLLRGGRTADQRLFVDVLLALAPTPEEYAARARDLVALLDGPSTVAGHAQGVLAGLDEAGLIELELLGEASAVVLFRAEKKLVRAQLGWLEKAARRSPERAGAVVLAAAGAFGHADSGVQERALNVVARHLKAAGSAVLPELRYAAEALNLVHHPRATELFGAPVGGDDPDTGWNEMLPPVPEPRPLGAPIASAAEVAEELSALLAAQEPEVADFERVLDGLVRHAHRDRAALVEALGPVLRVYPWNGVGRWQDCGPRDVLYVAAAVAGQAPPHRLWDFLGGKGRSPLRGQNNTVHGHVLAARLEEAAWQVTATRPPYLLATPTDATGAVDAAVLVERLVGYRAAGVTPGQADLCAALLRVGPTVGGEVIRAAEALTRPAGRWAAAWLRTGGLPAQPSERVVFAPGRGSRHGHAYGERWWEDLRRVAVAQPGIDAGPEGPGGERLAREFVALLDCTEPGMNRIRAQTRWTWQPSAHWAAMLPWHREELAARWLDWFASAADRDERGAGRLLPVLAEAGGPAGLALHLVLAYGLGARHTEDRTAAVDALLVLAARGHLDGALLGRELGALVDCGAVKPTRLSRALALAAGTGAYGTVWSVLAPALPALLTGDQTVRGLGDLVALAADCARRTGARGPIEEVTATAAKGGSGRVVKEARALRDVLADRT